ncbi:hypothetical protein [Kribbella sp. NPDC051770]|uniref:hypothetical protein n=1 Tax=Kribbella sp. NPDC051770 TaxID=3155413 RepID=UPI00341F12D3
MTVSVPEKTLEHWSSQYLNYRYRAKASLWWPAYGQDIDFGWLPRRPGKAVQLELKTTTVAGPMRHDVHIKLLQLWNYLCLPLSKQPFYAFPRPTWGGILAEAATKSGVVASTLAFQRSGPDWWFAEWMVVMSARDVARVLRFKIDPLGHRTAVQILASCGTTWPDALHNKSSGQILCPV